MLKKLSLLLLQGFILLGLLLTGCETNNSTEPVMVEKELSKTSGGMNASSIRSGTLLNPSFDYPTLASGTHASRLSGWTGLTKDCLVTSQDGSMPVTQSVCLVGWYNGVGDYSADAVLSDWINVNSNKRYRLSGYIYKCSTQDNAYLDFNDGIGWPANFTDVQVGATSTFQWQYVSVEIYIPWNVSKIRVRCVRDGANRYNALFDRLSFEQIN